MNTWLLIINLYSAGGQHMPVEMNSASSLAACEIEGKSIIKEYSGLIDPAEFWNPDAFQSITYDCKIYKTEIS